MARDTLLRTLLVGLALGALACGGKEEEEAPAVDMAAMRARRDSLRQAAVQDSTMRAKYTACSDSVIKVLGRSAAGRAALQKAAAGTVPPEVTKIFVTGLKPKTGYNVVQSVLKTGEVSVTVTVGTLMTTDEGGVLTI